MVLFGFILKTASDYIIGHDIIRLVIIIAY